MPSMIVTLTFDVQSGVTRTELREFIKTELEAGGGNRHPEDPLFRSLSNVTVKFEPRKTT
jgi:hypothetical protein